jgi:hypothetical protein
MPKSTPADAEEPLAEPPSAPAATHSERHGHGEFGCLLPGLIVTAISAGVAMITGLQDVAGISLPCLFWVGIVLTIAGGAFGWMNRDAEDAVRRPDVD